MPGRKIFGTDGVRGIANAFLTPELAFKLGRAAVVTLASAQGLSRPRVCIGRDTRLSGPLLQAAVEAGILSVGGDVVKLGIVPTPAVSYITKNCGFDLGCMISASHNPIADNGIKFFSSQGLKLSDEVERQIEAVVAQINEEDNLPRPTGTAVGQSWCDSSYAENYRNYLLATLPTALTGLKIVCDAACGAAAPLVEKLFQKAGADVHLIYGEADGARINVNCGSTDPSHLQRKVIELKADLGLAFDGDADRVIAVDSDGSIVNGDAIIYILSKHLMEQGLLQPAAVVGTVLSNMGLEVALKQLGIAFYRTKVGDRYILRKMLSEQLPLGGEQSGHIIYRRYAVTGDGLLTGLHLAAVVKQRGASLTELAGEMPVFPQVMHNVRVSDKHAVMGDDRLLQAVNEAERQLAGRGRVVLRPSGTEPVVRVMVEANSKEVAEYWASKLSKLVEELAD